MRHLVIGVSLAHLLLLGGFIRLGAIRPWQAIGSVFGGGPLWMTLMLSAICAPIVLGIIFVALDSVLRKFGPRVSAARDLTFIFVTLVAIFALLNAVLLADVEFLWTRRDLVYAFLERYSPVVVWMVTFSVLGLIAVCLKRERIRARLVAACRTVLCILAPATLLSVAGLCYILVRAGPLERSDDVARAGSRPPIRAGLPEQVLVLVFDAWSYDDVFNQENLVEGIPHLRAIAKQSLIFHNNRSFRGATPLNIPILLTGQYYKNITDLSGERWFPGEVGVRADDTRVVLQDQRNLFDLGTQYGYRPVVFGSSLRYCSRYVRGKGDCRSSPFGFNAHPRTLPEAVLEPYRYALESAVPFALHRHVLPVGGAFQMWGLQIHQSLLAALPNIKGAFLYAHFPIPHAPWVRYDSVSDTLSPSMDRNDSLRAVDTFLGEIWAGLQDAGAWDSALVILLSDHGYSDQLYSERYLHIPLIVKLPLMERRVDYRGPWTHAQLLPFLEELFKREEFDAQAALAVVHALAPSDL